MTSEQAVPPRVITDILDSLRRAREFLLDPSPQNIDCCGMLLGQCANRIVRLLENPAAACGAAVQLGLVREELNTITSLLSSAASFRRGLLRVMRAACPSATPVDTPSEKAQSVHVLC